MKKIFIISFFLLILMIGCKNNKPKYIFFITLDTTRGDFVNYKLNNKITPNLAELASKGMIFKNAFTVIPITLPSHSSMFYSRYPHELKIYNNGQIKKVKYLTMTQILKAKGYSTGAVISLGVLKKNFGLSKGFDEYVENFKYGLWYRTAEEVTRDSIRLIKKFKAKKSFFWIHYSDPHEPYFPPYYKGEFKVKYKGDILFKGNVIDKSLIKLKLTLSPGKNLIYLENKLPKELNNKNKFSIKFRNVSYIDFKIESDFLNKISMNFPLKWKLIKARKKTFYNTKELNSIITIENKLKKDIDVNISFLRALIVKRIWRKFLYKREVKYMDYWIGELIKYLKKEGIYDKSVFVVMGDHGEGLGEFKNHFGHIHYLYKVYTHVPMFVSGVGIKKEMREELVSNLNIAPTILQIAGIEKPDSMIGKSLLSKDLKHKSLLLETFSPEAYFDEFSLIEFPYQIIFHPGWKKNRLEIININKSRFGFNNIIDSKEVSNVKQKLINEILKISRIITATKGKPVKVSERDKEILKSLGYL